MMDITNLSKLSFFKVSKYEHTKTHVVDFSNIPRPHYCMGLIFRGTGKFKFENKCVTVGAGDIIFVPVNSTYISTWQGDPDVLYISAHFSFESHRVFGRTKRMDIQKITLPDFENLKQLYMDMFEKHEQNKTMQFSALSAFYNILSRVYPVLMYTDTKITDSRIEKAIDYIELHYKEKIYIDALAALCGMSPSYFYACFKACTDCSPIEYKQNMCIRRAALLLVDGTHKSIEEISELTGFSSSIYFRELFKKIIGKTPTEYRKYSMSEEYGQ